MAVVVLVEVASVSSEASSAVLASSPALPLAAVLVVVEGAAVVVAGAAVVVAGAAVVVAGAVFEVVDVLVVDDVVDPEVLGYAVAAWSVEPLPAAVGGAVTTSDPTVSVTGEGAVPLPEPPSSSQTQSTVGQYTNTVDVSYSASPAENSMVYVRYACQGAACSASQ